MIFLRNLEDFLRNLDQIQKKFRNFMRISRKKFTTFFAIFVSRPTTRPGFSTPCKQGLSNDDDEDNENYVRKKKGF